MCLSSATIGFTGSVGSAVIGTRSAWLWADSRYWLQAEHELDAASYTLMRQGDSEVPSIPRFLAQHAEGQAVGFDPMLHTPAEAAALTDALAGAGARLVAVDNLIDRIWTTDRPPIPTAPVTPWPAALSGRSLGEKLAALRSDLQKEGADHLVVATLDELAWTFDLRGQDVDFNPVTIAWGLVSSTGATSPISRPWALVSLPVPPVLATAMCVTSQWERRFACIPPPKGVCPDLVISVKCMAYVMRYNHFTH